MFEYFANLKSESTNEPDEDCQEVCHGEHQHQHCKLTIAKPEEKHMNTEYEYEEKELWEETLSV